VQSITGQKGVPDADKLTQQTIADEKQYILQTYARPDLVFVHGEGTKVWDAHGKEYLDFSSGIAVNALGHSDKRWLAAVTDQAAKLAHTSNLFHTVPQVELAKKLVQRSFADKVFFSNSGTEANEACIKFARKYARVQAGIDPYDANATAPHEIVYFSSSFHGRTLGALALTYKDQYKTPFMPILPGAKMAKYCDLESAKQQIQKGKTCAVIVEPLQGEGGIYSSSKEFLEGLRRLCDEAGALLIFDEVQCGLGRTGKLWAHEHFGVEPDMMSLAKPLAGGLPIGAVLLKQKVADVMSPGDHGSTFAGNPLVCHAANAVFDVVADPSFLQSIEQKGQKLRAGLQKALGSNPHVKEIRGKGLICGVQLDTAAGTLCTKARDAGLIVITAGKGDVVRLVPPLTVTEQEIDTCCSILGKVAAEVLG
jgi:acetylornithine aminotransferase